MKKMLFTLLMVLSTIVCMSQTIGEAFYVYRNDGMINTFFRSEIDSISYSYYDADSILYDEIVSQVVYTPDSIYQIPLAVIDSVGFVTPETKYLPDVIILEGTIRDYIIGSDSLTIYFHPNTPTGILPNIGDKLVTTEMSAAFEIGFAGEVVEIQRQADRIDIICTGVELSDVFETYYGFTTIDSPPQGTAQNGTRKININKSGSKVINLGSHDFEIPSNWWASVIPFEGYTVSGRLRFGFHIAPKLTINGSIIVNKERGTFISLSSTTDLSMGESVGFTGKMSEEKKFGIPIQTPPFAVMPFVRMIIEPGVFARIESEGSINMAFTQEYQHVMRFTYSSRDESVRQAECRLIPINNTFDGSAYLKGRIAGGVYLDCGFTFIDKLLAKAYVNMEGGFMVEVSGDTKITSSDMENAMESTALYNRLHSSYLAINKYFGSSLKVDLLKNKVFEIETPLRSRDRIATLRYVPTFNSVSLTPNLHNNGISMDASSTVTGTCFLPSKIGYTLFDEERYQIGQYFNENSYRGGGRNLSHTFTGLKPNMNYYLYPTIIHNDLQNGIEMLASPSSSCRVEITPITIEATNIETTSATAWGRIEGYEVLGEAMTFGLGYMEEGSMGRVLYDASSFYLNNIFSVEFKALKPNTTYKYFAYLSINGEMYYGEEKEFTTKGGAMESYYVWDGAGSTVTYYYDNMRSKRNGWSIIENTIFVPNNVVNVMFDSSFSNYYPKRVRFAGCKKLQKIDNIKYLNTDSITDMYGMFIDCEFLSILDLSSFNTSNVTDMRWMFSGCSSLASLNLSNFNTSNVTEMQSMFDNCSSLTSLDLSSFDTSNVTNMREMFYNCSSLTSLNLSSFNTSNVTNMSSMFCYCSSLTSLDLRNLNTSNVTDMAAMFYLCSSLTYLDLSNFNTSNVTDMMTMFHGNLSLRNLNVSSFNTSNVENMQSMFSDCKSLTSLDLSNFNTSNVRFIGDMFNNCSSLVTIYGGNWIDTLNHGESGFTTLNMFYGCEKLVGEKGTKIGENFYGYDELGTPLYYYCCNYGNAACIDGGWERPGLFTSK